jgi:photosystem II stability/assembly factor-like uncharacterized protein
MKRVVVYLTLTAVLALVCAVAAQAAGLSTVPGPTVSAVEPASAANDIDVPVTITGADFATGEAGAMAPTVTLGDTALANVTVVDSTTLTATVPWGMDPGSYALTVANPDGGSAGLPAAFTVTQGIGRWNGAALYGGDVRQILMKPGDPNTLYAPAYGLVGLFRSTDAAATWQYVGGSLALGNNDLTVDPQHPSWLWAYTAAGVERSTDQGATWTTVMEHTWPDGRPIAHGQVYPSPSDPQVLFVSSYHEPLESGSSDDAQGLIRSSDGGATWQVVADLADASVVDVTFDPTDASRMALVTQDARVFSSGDAGQTWTQGASPAIAGIGITREIVCNPLAPAQVWIVSTSPDGVFRSTDAALSGWQDVTPPNSLSSGIAFTGANSVYLNHWSSADGGAHWQPFGPQTGNGSLLFSPANAQVGYVADSTYGVQKTTDGGQHWAPASQGLAGMTCNSMSVSRADPLRVLATFGNWPGVYRSRDGAGTWSYLPIPGSGVAGVVRTDPVEADGVYATGYSGIQRSTTGGETWTDLGWNTSPPAPQDGMLFDVEPDPFQPGRLLAAWDTGAYLTGPGYLYSSDDHGASWQAVTLPQAVARITDITFDPGTSGVAYIATAGAGDLIQGTGVYRSTDHGDTWQRIDDRDKPGMSNTQTIVVATHPRRLLYAAGRSGGYRSADGGDTGVKSQNSPGTSFLFAAADSTRLYAGDSSGLFFSSDGGDTWARAAGAFGRLQILALGDAQMDGRTVVYAATNGGQAGTSGSAAKAGGAARDEPRAAHGATTIAAGIYRYVVLTPRATLKLSGLRSGVLSHAGVSCDYQADLEACSGDLAEFCRFAQAAQGLDPYFTLNVRQCVVTARCVAVFAMVARTR